MTKENQPIPSNIDRDLPEFKVIKYVSRPTLTHWSLPPKREQQLLEKYPDKRIVVIGQSN